MTAVQMCTAARPLNTVKLGVQEFPFKGMHAHMSYFVHLSQAAVQDHNENMYTA